MRLSPIEAVRLAANLLGFIINHIDERIGSVEREIEGLEKKLNKELKNLDDAREVWAPNDTIAIDRVEREISSALHLERRIEGLDRMRSMLLTMVRMAGKAHEYVLALYKLLHII